MEYIGWFAPVIQTIHKIMDFKKIIWDFEKRAQVPLKGSFKISNNHLCDFYKGVPTHAGLDFVKGSLRETGFPLK